MPILHLLMAVVSISRERVDCGQLNHMVLIMSPPLRTEELNEHVSDRGDSDNEINALATRVKAKVKSIHDI
jgi:hypothetical protein